MKNRKKTGVLPAKLTMPTVDNAVLRARLFQRLDDALDKPVAWIGAPAGTGKTMLVASYLAERKIRPLWYQCDARDTDPAAFFAYLRQAAGKLAPRKLETLPLLTPEYALGLPVFTLNFFEQLFSRIHSQAVLVFDNFQELSDTSPLHELWQSVGTLVPEGITLIFISRNSPPESFAQLRATQRLTHIDAETMRLDSEEAQMIGKRMATNTLTAEQITLLNKKTGGWVAGLILLMQKGEISLTEESEADANLFDYFAAEVMRYTDTETQDFLMECSLLPVMDANSTATLTGNENAGAILKHLVRCNYFIGRLPGEVMRYEFHPLFRTYLLNELIRRRDTERLCSLRQRAGHILVEQDEYAAAVELLTEAGDIKAIILLVLANAEKLLIAGQFQTLMQWLQTVPKDAYQQQPWLYYWLGASYMHTDIAAARGHYETAYSMFVEHDDIAGIYMSWVGVVDTILNLLDNFHALKHWIDQLEQHIAEYGQPAPPLMLHLAPRMYGALIMVRPQHPGLGEWKSSALAAFDAEQNLSLKLLCGFYLSVAATWADDFSAANAMLMKLRRVGEAYAAVPAVRIVRELFESWINWLSGDATLAQKAAETGITIGQESGVRIWEPLMILEAMISAITAGDLAHAAGFAGMLKPMLPYVRLWDRAYYFHESGWLAALNGNFAEALRLQSEALRLMLELGGSIAEVEVSIGMAQAHDLNGNTMERDELVREAHRIAEETQIPLMIFSSSFVAATYALDDGDLEQARDLAAKAMHTGNRQGYRNFTWWLPQQASRLCAFCLEQNIETEYVRELIRVRRLVPDDELHSSSTWPWPVKIYVMGRFSLVLGNKQNTPSSKSQGRVITMLKLLIALGGREVAEQQISDQLWPDADGDQARQNFKTTLHRLRKLIGQESLQMSEGRLSLDSHRVWVDAWALDRKLNKLESSDTNELLSLIGDLIDIYQGGLLPGESASWVLPARERLRGRFLRIIGQAAERLCELDQWQTAIDCYHKALETDPLAERFYIGLMRCHHQLGQMAEGIAIYRCCHEILANELQLPPSIETEQWHQKLSHSHH